MGKKLLLLAVLALAIPVAAHDRDIDQIIFSNSGGTLKGSSKGLALSGSVLTAIQGPDRYAVSGSNLGTVSITTGALSGGFLSTGGRFAQGGSINISANGKGGIHPGTLFKGVFTGPLAWSMTTLSNGTHEYTLTGVANGEVDGTGVKNVSLKLTVNTGRGFYDGSAVPYSGTTTAAVADADSHQLLNIGI
jgi:hypothetical protein